MAEGRERKAERTSSLRRDDRATPVPKARSLDADVEFLRAVEPGADAPASFRARGVRAKWIAGVACVVALVFVAIGRSFVVRAVLPLALALVAIAMWLRARNAKPRPARRPSRGIAIHADRIAFVGDAPSTTLVTTTMPFGVTLVATRRRDRVVAMVSSASGVFAAGAAFDGAARKHHAALVDRASTTASDELGLDAVGPDGAPLLLGAGDLARLVDVLVERNPTCLERFVSTDARGAALTLDSRALAVGDTTVDLMEPLEWRSMVFQEAFGQALAVYQGTWIRQGGIELVLVSLLPSLAAVSLGDAEVYGLDREALRDIRLTQGSAEAPPPAEQRVAIERLFMLPVRSALDRAPRAARQANRALA